MLHSAITTIVMKMITATAGKNIRACDDSLTVSVHRFSEFLLQNSYQPSASARDSPLTDEIAL
jgi:hypothetical protein